MLHKFYPMFPLDLSFCVGVQGVRDICIKDEGRQGERRDNDNGAGGLYDTKASQPIVQEESQLEGRKSTSSIRLNTLNLRVDLLQPTKERLDMCVNLQEDCNSSRDRLVIVGGPE